MRTSNFWVETTSISFRTSKSHEGCLSACTCLTKQIVIKLCDFVYSFLTDQKLGKLSPNGRTLSAMGQLNERSRDNQLVVLVTLLLKG